MKVYKAAVCLVLTTLIFLLLSAKTTVASADGTPSYAYVELYSTVYLYKDKDEKAELFAIPQTYCAEILDASDEKWYYVKYAEDNEIYQSVYGYCLKDEVTVTTTPPEKKYLYYTLSVIYHAEGANGNLAAPKDLEVRSAYYGEYTLGSQTCSYVLCNGGFCYIPFKIGYYDKNDAAFEPTFAEAKGGNSSAMLITAVAITGIAAAAIVVLYFTGKKPKLTATQRENNSI